MKEEKWNILPVWMAMGVVFLMLVSMPLAVYLSKQNQETRSLAATCAEACPGSDGMLHNCHPPDSDGTAQLSLCNTKGRRETCGTQTFCCPSAGGTWTTDLTACPLPTSTPTPTPKATATPTPTPTTTVASCTISSWSPDPATKCSGVSFTQTSNCGSTRTVSGTNSSGSCCTDSSWSPSASDQCSGVSFTQTSNCGSTRTVSGTNSSGSCCTDSSWSPSASSYCTSTSITQTSNCGRTRTVSGTKTSGDCCVPNGKISCGTGCPTGCGYGGGNITCYNSCGKAVLRSCAATVACGLADGVCKPVDGGWTEWGPCSATICGESGTQTRVCNNPAASCGGKTCTGDWVQSCVAEDCNLTTSEGGVDDDGLTSSGLTNSSLPDIQKTSAADDAQAAQVRAEIVKIVLTILLIVGLLVLLYFVYLRIKKQDEETETSQVKEDESGDWSVPIVTEDEEDGGEEKSAS